MNLLSWGALAVCIAAALGSCVFGLHRARALMSRRRPLARASILDDAAPRVLVQLPLYNEAHVAARVIEAACALDWPRDRLLVQVLDDSDDDVTPAAVDAACARARRGGVQVEVVRRPTRAGFKAGALAHGLARADAPFVAIFDADFVPPRDFLRRALAHFDDDVGMVQCRWGHMNADERWLTRAQAALLDAHFGVEQAGRAGAGRFFGFNGTAGVWRTATIAEAGGWDAHTLTEDLDLALRAHLAGARFVYLDDVTAPAELPSDARALRRQQERWTRGALECARLRLPAVWRAPLPLGRKLDLTLKLTQNLSWVLLCALVVALPVCALAAFAAGAPGALPADAGAVGLALAVSFVVGTAPVVLSIVVGARGRVRGARLACDVVLALALASALALTNARAALRGLTSRGHAPFLRTPKRGDAARAERLAPSAMPLVEIGVGVLHLAASAVAPAPVMWLCGAGLCALGAADLRAGARSRAA